MTLSFDAGAGSPASRRYLAVRSLGQRGSANRLSSGLRIPTAADDASGIGISEVLRSQVRSLSGASRNTLEGLDLARTADGALSEVGELMCRIRELVVEASNGTLTSADQATIDEEVQGLVAEIDRVAGEASFNGVHLLDGTTASVAVQDGLGAGETTDVALTDATAAALGLGGLDVRSLAGAASAIGAIDSAIYSVNSARGSFGATQNALDSRHSMLQETSTQLSAAESRIRDVDVAMETANRARVGILQDVTVALQAHHRVDGEQALRLTRP